MERRHKITKVVASGEEEQEQPRCFIEDVPDELLRLILLHLDSPLWLLRAACACKRWRRVVVTGDGGADDGGLAFLRLASSLHPPAVLGHYQNNIDGGHRFVPLSPTNGGGRFSLDFIPRDLVSGTTPMEDWEVADCHGGLVLLREKHGFLSDLVVCDPLTRRYRRIHHPPGQGVEYLLCRRRRRRRWWPGVAPGAVAGYYLANIFLIDGDDGNTSISNFRVLYRFDDGDDEYVGSQLYVFSMADGGGGWRFLRWSQLDDRYRDGFGRVAGRVDGALYLGLHTGAVTVLDKDKLEFCKVDLPPIDRDVVRSTFAVVHGAGAAAAGTDPTSPSAKAVFIVRVHGETLELFRRQARGSGGDQWVLEHSIPELSTATRGLAGYPDRKRFRWWQTVEVIAGGTGFVILSAWVYVPDQGTSMSWLFSFNVDTMELQAVTIEAAYCGKMVTSTYTLPWPRLLCPGRSSLKPNTLFA